MQDLLNNPDFRKQFIKWIETSLADGSNHLATSNQGTLLLYQQDGNRCVVKAAMGRAAVYKARLATLRREYQAYMLIQGIDNIPDCYGFLQQQYMVIEYIPGSPYRHASWQDRDLWFAQFKQTIEDFHKRGVAHGDLKSKSNISSTLAKGSANACPPSTTIKVGIMARVSGTLIIIVLPTPSTESTSTVPLS